MRPTSTVLAALAVVIFSSGGCANLIAQMKAKSGGTAAELQTALDAGDWETVGVYCTGQDKAGAKVHWKAKRTACDAKEANAKAMGDKDMAAATCADLR